MKTQIEAAADAIIEHCYDGAQALRIARIVLTAAAQHQPLTEDDITQPMIQAGRYAANLNDSTLARIYLAMRTVEWEEAQAEDRDQPPASSGNRCASEEGGAGGDVQALAEACRIWPLNEAADHEDEAYRRQLHYVFARGASWALGGRDQPPASSGKALTGKAQGAWRPISTAPRNDKLVMLGWWCDVGGDPRWIAVAGWYEAGLADRCWYAAYDEERVEPTHWQPLDRLPAPPSSGQGGH